MISSPPSVAYSFTSQWVLLRSAEEYDKKPHIQGHVGVKTLFYRISILFKRSVDFSINNGSFQTSRSCTLCFFSPFHSVTARQKSNLKGKASSSRNHLYTAPTKQPVPRRFFLFSGATITFFLWAKKRHHPDSIGGRIIYEYNALSRYADIVVRDYLQPLPHPDQRIIGTRERWGHFGRLLIIPAIFYVVNKSWPLSGRWKRLQRHSLHTGTSLVDSKKTLRPDTVELSINECWEIAQTMLLHSEQMSRRSVFRLEFRKNHISRAFLKTWRVLAQWSTSANQGLETGNQFSPDSSK